MIALSSEQQAEWEKSYVNRDNFVFYPNEEIIRFVSRHIRKRTGLRKLESYKEWDAGHPRMLDLGCGIGRHIMYAHEMNIEAYGIDLSAYAIETAHEWANAVGFPDAEERIRIGDVRSLPWDDGFFDVVVSHGVLDSMHFEIAREAIVEVARVMEDSGLFYCDLISGDDTAHAREFAGEEVVQTRHEEGTIQSYFNYAKIRQLIEPHFECVEANLIRKENVLTGHFGSRYHLVLKKLNR